MVFVFVLSLCENVKAKGAATWGKYVQMDKKHNYRLL